VVLRERPTIGIMQAVHGRGVPNHAEQFGQASGEFQLIQRQVADMSPQLNPAALTCCGAQLDRAKPRADGPRRA